MKKIILTIYLLLVATTCPASVQQVCDEIPFQIRIIDPTEHNPIMKLPIVWPVVTLEGYTLFFDSSCVDNTILLVQNGVVVYSGVVSTTLQFTLPSTLSGEYELQLIRGNFCFYSFISL